MKMLSHICIGLTWAAAAACAASAALGAETASAAPANKSRLPGGSWASIARLPDWSGNWVTSRESGAEIMKMILDAAYPNAPRLTPAYETQLRQGSGIPEPGKGTAMVQDNALQCLPHGMPLMMALPSPIGYEFLFTPGRVTIVNEEGEVRRIYTDGRSHNVDADATFSGESIGHWEGQTLIVDTVAIKPKAMLMVFIVQSSEKTHVIERIRLKDKNTLEIDTTVEDPIVLASPWHYRLTFERSPSGFIEYVCTENNREHGGELNLTPPE